MSTKQWKIYITGRFIALVLLSLLSLSASATITATCPTNPNATIYNTNYLTNINVCGPLPGQTSPIRQYTLNDVTITLKSNGSIFASGKCATGIDNIGTLGYNNSCGSNPTTQGLWACAAGDNRACYKTDGTSSAACTSNQTRDSSLNCVTNTPTITQDCPKDQYRDTAGGACQAIPDCNTTTVTGGNYFDIGTRQCQSSNATLKICIGTNEKWCPATDDCIKSGVICSDNLANINATNTAQTTVTPAKKTEATNSATQAAAASTAAATLKIAADNNAVTKQTAYNQASTNYQQNPTLSGAQQLSSALDAFQTASTKADNVTGSSSASNTSAVNSATAANTINNSTTKPGEAENLAQQADYWKNEAIRAMQAAGRGTTYIINNFPLQGTSGDGDNPDQNQDGHDADGDGTPDGIDKNDVDTGQSPNFGNTPSITESNQALIAALNDYPPIDGINQIRSMNFGGSGNCPGLVLDTGSAWFGSLSTNAHCEIIANHSTLIQNMARVIWVTAAIFLFFSA
jgi:hypothetical protein